MGLLAGFWLSGGPVIRYQVWCTRERGGPCYQVWCIRGRGGPVIRFGASEGGVGLFSGFWLRGGPVIRFGAPERGEGLLSGLDLIANPFGGQLL